MIKGKLTKVGRVLIKYISTQEQSFSAEKEQLLWERIDRDIEMSRAKKKFNFFYFSVAASLVFLIASVVLYSLKEKSVHTDFQLISDNLVLPESDLFDREDILLTVSVDKQVTVSANTTVSYSKIGVLQVGDKEIDQSNSLIQNKKDNNSQEAEFNQLVVPKGKRTQLKLADGSVLWINSCTRVVYPVKFTGQYREIYVEGEAYVDVVPDKSHPFIVKTPRFDVEVLGTSFNISAYDEDVKQEVVLVQGAVVLKDKHQRKIDLSPNELVTVNEKGIIGKTPVNALNYICWKDDMLKFESTPLSHVFQRLSRYYDVKIDVDPSAQVILLSGKLDLRDRILDVLHLLSETTAIIYHMEGDVIKIKRK